MGSGLGLWFAVGGLRFERKGKSKSKSIKNPGPQLLSCSPGW